MKTYRLKGRGILRSMQVRTKDLGRIGSDRMAGEPYRGLAAWKKRLVLT